MRQGAVEGDLSCDTKRPGLRAQILQHRAVAHDIQHQPPVTGERRNGVQKEMRPLVGHQPADKTRPQRQCQVLRRNKIEPRWIDRVLGHPDNLVLKGRRYLAGRVT